MKDKPEDFILTCGERKISLTLCTPNIIHVKLLPLPEYEQCGRIIVEPKKWEHVPYQIVEEDDLTISTEYLALRVDKKETAFEFYDRHGTLLLSSKKQCFRSVEHTEDEEGLTPVGVAFKTCRGEHFYGLGDGGEGFDRKGHARKIWTENVRRVGSEIAAPFILSTRGYGLFFHNPYESSILADEGTLSYEAVGGGIDVYFMYGPSIDEILGNYLEIMGKPPLLPKWAFGYQQSSRHFMNSMEVMDLPKVLRKRKIPCDHLTFLSTYSSIYGRQQGWDAGIAHPAINPFLWPEPEKNIRDMRKQHFNIMFHQYPQISRDCAEYKEFFEKGFFVKRPDSKPMTMTGYEIDKWNSSYIDFTNPDAREWWWTTIRKFFKMGVNSWWHDGGEGPIHGTLYDGSYKKIHNVHDLFRDRLLYEKIREEFPERRVLLRCRSGYAGIQRYGVMLQPGDMDSDLDTLSRQIEKSLNSAMSGFPFRGHDAGGHFSQMEKDPTVMDLHTYIGGDSRTDERYIRGLQFSAFNSIFWAHGHPWRSKLPWMRGPVIEETVKKIIELRYKFIPYIYTNAWIACTTGAPMQRALVLDFPDDANVYDLGTQYLFGKNLMVAPVLKEGAEKWDVYLPRGKWYDFWTNKEYIGHTTITIDVDIESIPLFVKAGGIIPLGPAMQYVTEKELNPVTLLMYPDERASEFTLYEDDGETYGYEQGEYALTKYTCANAKDGSIVITIDTPRGNFEGMTASRNYVVKVYSTSHPQKVVVDGKELPKQNTACAHEGWSWTKESKTVCMLIEKVKNTQEIRII
ncbi:MAG: DUF5110 domain-containing protein [bacterium]|nr:DUF5110 domain-containing protein [bacterium]